MKEHNIVGIDLAKNVFHICVMSPRGRVLARKRVSRKHLFRVVVQYAQGVVAMEACGGAHYWGRLFREQGLEVLIIPARFVKPYVKSNKNDTIDAEAICEAASRERMRYVAVKSEEQQEVQSLHRIRQRVVRNRTRVINQIRGLLLEYGITIPKGASHLRRCLPMILEQEQGKHSVRWYWIFEELYQELVELEETLARYEQGLTECYRNSEAAQRLEKVPGVGKLTATALASCVGKGEGFKNGRQFAAWLGLTPHEFTTGGKQRLGSISKRGDTYLRTLLVRGAFSSVVATTRKAKAGKVLNAEQDWVLRLAQKRGKKFAAVALANKNARRIWSILAKEQEYQPQEEVLPLAA